MLVCFNVFKWFVCMVMLFVIGLEKVRFNFKAFILLIIRVLMILKFNL